MMSWTMDWARAIVESPLTGNYDISDDESLLFCNNTLIAKVKTLQKKVKEHTGASECNVDYDKLLGVITVKPKYPTICPHCGAPHNPNESKCEYCDGYMKEE